MGDLWNTLKRIVSPRSDVPGGRKGRAESLYWIWKMLREGRLTRHHYKEVYTQFFGLDEDFYDGKAILDVGCGPRGSLEWAVNAQDRVGLDPLAETYLELGATEHSMTYVAAGAEAIPFPDRSFDVVCSFNSLDHVEDVERSAAEIQRVLKPGGSFLLISDVGHRPTVTEPAAFGWEVIDLFSPPMIIVSEERYEKTVRGGIYKSIRNGVPYDVSDPRRRYGVLKVHFQVPSE